MFPGTTFPTQGDAHSVKIPHRLRLEFRDWLVSLSRGRCDGSGMVSPCEMMNSSLSSVEPDTHTSPEETASRAIVFFDGVCGLCNSTVDFLIARDRFNRLAYAPLQGETADRLLSEDLRQNLRTLVLRTEEGRQYVRSAAVVRMLWRLGGVWMMLAALLWVIPLPLRDLGYRLVSTWRYRLFGQRETCRLPTPEDADRMLP